MVTRSNANGFKQSKEIAIGSNVLNAYRSITYNFTLAGLPVNYLSNPEAYRTGELNYVILKSGGKGDKLFSSNAVASNTGKSIVTDFNKFSPGRFDMFIENVEIDSLMTFNQNSNASLPTKIKFEIIEPYSINGFIEALHIAAVASGYSSYINASFLLKLEFFGYPDSEEFGTPIKIPNTERFFPIGLTNVEVEITEKGTKYSCTAVPYNERAFGQPSVVKKPIKMTGITVKQILDNFIEELNKQVVQSSKDVNPAASNSDTYEIVFKERKDGVWKTSSEHPIAKSPLLELYEDNALYKFAQPKDVASAYKPGTKPKSINPTGTVVNFQEGSNIHDIITAVIRDSKYVRDMLENLADPSRFKSQIDQYGFVDYFLINVETRNKDEIDPNTKRPYQIFTFVVTPYKIHYSRIPTYGSVKIKEEELRQFATREYNYIYTGNNIDVLNFKLNFNTLYFEAIPASLGDKNSPNFKDSAKPSNDTKPVFKGTSPIEEQDNTTHATPPVYTDVTPVQGVGGTAVSNLNSPYALLAKNMHEAVINSKASMITGTINILGDPFYLVTGGLGNYNPKEVAGKIGTVGNDEVDRLKGEVNIVINFRNPIDIDTFENGGKMYFDPNRVAFSGIYMVTKVVSTFKDGKFTQAVDIIRKPGQILKEEKNKVPVNPGDLYTSIPNDDNRSTQSSPRAPAISVRANSQELATVFNRGTPSSGLPGVPVDHTGATAPSSTPGLLGGSNFAAQTSGVSNFAAQTSGVSNFAAQTSGVSNLLAQNFGVSNPLTQLTSAAGVIGQALPSADALTSNIRLNQAGLTNLGQSAFSSAALLNSAANILTGNANAKTVLGNIAGSIIGSELSKALNKFNIGSGIGEGKTISINPSSILNSVLTSNEIKSGINIDNITGASALMSNALGTIKDLGTNAINTVNKLGSEAENLINNVGDNIGNALQSISDPGAAAAKLGIDSAKLSGLSAGLESKLSKQIDKIKEFIPENANLKQLVENGVALNIIPVSKYINLPPPAPFKTADAFINKVTESPILNPLKNLTSNNNRVDATILNDKIESVKTQLSNITNLPNIKDRSISGSVGSVFGSNQNPLDKLVNRLNDPNAEPYTGNDPIIRSRLGLPPLTDI